MDDQLDSRIIGLQADSRGGCPYASSVPTRAVMLPLGPIERLSNWGDLILRTGALAADRR